jgi:hypothetical protein
LVLKFSFSLDQYIKISAADRNSSFNGFEVQTTCENGEVFNQNYPEKTKSCMFDNLKPNQKYIFQVSQSKVGNSCLSWLLSDFTKSQFFEIFKIRKSFGF